MCRIMLEIHQCPDILNKVTRLELLRAGPLLDSNNLAMAMFSLEHMLGRHRSIMRLKHNILVIPNSPLLVDMLLVGTRHLLRLLSRLHR